MYYNNLMESDSQNLDTLKYYKEDNYKNKNAKVVFEISNSEAYNLNKYLIKYASKFIQYKWTFTKNNDGNYVFASVEKVK